MAYIRQSKIKTKNEFFVNLFKLINEKFGKENVEKYFYYPDSYNFSNGLVKKLQIKISKDFNITKIKAPFDVLKSLKTSTGKTIDFNQKSKIEFYMTGGRNGSGKLPIKGEVTRSPKTEQQESGTIFCIEYYLKNKKMPSLEKINKKIGFEFDSDYYLSFREQVKACEDSKMINNKSKIFLDSASKGDHSELFKNLKKLGYNDKKDNWNPADIWVFNVRKTEIYNELKIASSVNEYNDIIKRLFEEKKLIGISLKKISKKGKFEIVDPTKRETIQFTLKNIDYKNGQANFMINSKENFIIRAGFKAGAGKIYYEGKMQGTKVQLGAISKIYISEYIKNVVKEDIIEFEKDWKKSKLPIEEKNNELIKKSIDVIVDVMKKDKDFLKNMYYSAMKQMDTSSIYLKIY
jgi:hypothetical protein